MIRSPLVLLVLCASFLAACGSNGDEPRSGRTFTEPTATTATAAGPVTRTRTTIVEGVECTGTGKAAVYHALEEELTAAAQTYVREGKARDLKQQAPRKIEGVVGVLYGCAAGVPHAFGSLKHDLKACQTDLQASFTHTGRVWQATEIRCAGDVGPICELTPKALRDVWYEPNMREGCGWPSPTQSAGNSSGFKSPSGNIACNYYDIQGPELMCSVLSLETDKGQVRWTLPLKGKVVKDTVDGNINTDVPVLDYGVRWEEHGFLCSSSTEGVQCNNASQAGVLLSRQRQEIYAP